MADSTIERDIHNVLGTFSDAYDQMAAEVSECDDRDAGGDVAKETLSKILGICASPCGKHVSCSMVHEMWYGVDWRNVADGVVEDGHWENNDEDDDDDE